MAKEAKPLTVDIRVFMLITVSAMAIAFGVGVAMGPTAAELALVNAGSKKLPEVHSVDVQSVEDAAAAKEDLDVLHEPAGQVRKRIIEYLLMLGCNYYYINLF